MGVIGDERMEQVFPACEPRGDSQLDSVPGRVMPAMPLQLLQQQIELQQLAVVPVAPESDGGLRVAPMSEPGRDGCSCSPTHIWGGSLGGRLPSMSLGGRSVYSPPRAIGEKRAPLMPVDGESWRAVGPKFPAGEC